MSSCVYSVSLFFRPSEFIVPFSFPFLLQDTFVSFPSATVVLNIMAVMHVPHLFSAGLVLALMLHTTIAAIPPGSAQPKALVLKPLRAVRRGSEKRAVDRRALLELRTEESFHWGDENGVLMAQFRVATPSSTESIVNLEHMIDDGAIRTIECPAAASGPGPLKITFAEAADLHHALSVWEWVNQDSQHHFTMVLGPEDCGSRPVPAEEEGARIVYDVSRLSYSGNGQTAVLDVQQTTWKNVAHTFDLTIGKLTGASDLRRRDFGSDVLGFIGEGVDIVTSAAAPIIATATAVAGAVVSAVVDALPPLDGTQDVTVPLDAQLSGQNVSFGQDGAGVTATCLNCSTSGAFAFTARFRVDQGEFKEASLQMTTERPFAARALARVQVNKTISVPVISTSIPIFERDAQAVILSGVLEIGPRFEIGLGIEVDAIAGDLDVTAGGLVTVPAQSVLRLDMLSQTEAGAFDTRGWTLNFQKDEPIVAGFSGAKVTTSLRPSVAMVMDLFKTASITAEVFAKTPFVAGTFKDIASANCSACGGHEEGIQGDFALGAFFGARIRAKIGEGIPSIPIPLRSFTFAEEEVPMGGFCEGSDPAGSVCPGKEGGS